MRRFIPFIGVIVLLAVGSPAHAAAGDSMLTLQQYASGPLLALIAALGIIATLYYWSIGNKKAMWFGLGGLIFLGVMKALITQFWSSSGAWGGSFIGAGLFPVYGDTGAVSSSSSDVMRESVRSWGMLGAYYCNKLVALAWTIQAPAIVILIASLVIYYRITYKHQAGSVANFLIVSMLLTVAGLVPLVSFQGRTQPGLVEQALQGINDTNSVGATQNLATYPIPIIPALVITQATDVVTAIGEALNKSPTDSYGATVVIASRSSQINPSQMRSYRNYYTYCAPAAAGVRANDAAKLSTVDQSPSDAGVVSPYSVSRYAQGFGRGRDPFVYTALSPWGDTLYFGIPFRGYVAGTEAEAHAAYDLAFMRYLPIERDNGKHSQLDQLLGVTFAVATPSAAIDALPDAPESPPGYAGTSNFYTRPIGWTDAKKLSDGEKKVPFENGHLYIPTCALKGDDGTSTVSFTRNDVKTDVVWHVSTQATSPVLTAYAAQLAAHADGKEATIHYVAVADITRANILSYYQPSVCQAICGTPSHPDWWGCLVTGAFQPSRGAVPADILTNPDQKSHECYIAGSTSNWFWNSQVPVVVLGRYTQVGKDVTNNVNDYPTRGTAADIAGSAFPANDTGPVKRSAIDLLFAGYGIAKQIGVAGAAASPSGSAKDADDPSFSFFSIFKTPMTVILWLLGVVAAGVAFLIKLFVPHFMGIVLLLALVVYPFAACVALWPGKWSTLIDWTLGAAWVIAWWIPISLGMAMINGGMFGSDISVVMGSDSPGGGAMMMVGAALVAMAPSITMAFMRPGLDTIGSFGSQVFGTSLKVIGFAVAAGLAVATGGASMAAGAGMGANDASKSKGDGAGTEGATKDEADIKGGGGGGGGSGGGKKSAIVSGAMRGASFGMATSRAATSTVGTVAGMVGASSLEGGMSTGQGAGEATVREAGAGAGLGARIAARGVAGRVASGNMAADGTAANLARDVAHGSGGTDRGTLVGALTEGGSGLLGSGSDQVTQDKLMAGNQKRLDGDMTKAMAAGDKGGALSAMMGNAATSRARMQNAIGRGDLATAAEQASRVAEVESQANTHGLNVDPERANSAAKQAMSVGQEVERAGIATGNQAWVQAGRATQTKASEFMARNASHQAGKADAQADEILGAQADALVASGAKTESGAPMTRSDAMASAESKLTDTNNSSADAIAYRHMRGQAREQRAAAQQHGENAMAGYAAEYQGAQEQQSAAAAAIAKQDGKPTGAQTKQMLSGATSMAAAAQQSEQLAADLGTNGVSINAGVTANQARADLAAGKSGNTGLDATVQAVGAGVTAERGSPAAIASNREGAIQQVVQSLQTAASAPDTPSDVRAAADSLLVQLQTPASSGGGGSAGAQLAGVQRQVVIGAAIAPTPVARTAYMAEEGAAPQVQITPVQQQASAEVAIAPEKR